MAMHRRNGVDNPFAARSGGGGGRRVNYTDHRYASNNQSKGRRGFSSLTITLVIAGLVILVYMTLMSPTQTYQGSLLPSDVTHTKKSIVNSEPVSQQQPIAKRVEILNIPKVQADSTDDKQNEKSSNDEENEASEDPVIAPDQQDSDPPPAVSSVSVQPSSSPSSKPSVKSALDPAADGKKSGEVINDDDKKDPDPAKKTDEKIVDPTADDDKSNGGAAPANKKQSDPKLDDETSNLRGAVGNKAAETAKR